MATEQQAAAETARPKITISSVLTDLSNGMERKQIGEKYGLNFTQTRKLFQDPKLKGKKVKKPVEAAFELVDDTVESTVGTATAVNKKTASKANQASAATVSTAAQANLSDDEQGDANTEVSAATVAGVSEEVVNTPAPVEEVKSEEGAW